MENFYFVVNPTAASGMCASAFETAKRIMTEKRMEFTYAVTEYKGHAVELVKEALSAGYKCIVAVGGDGTVNEVASALANTGVTMGILPFGTGNDFARVTGISTDPASAVETLVTCPARKVDAGMANDRFFINLAGFGFDVDVLINTERYKKRFPRGMTSYLLGIIKSLAGMKPFHLTIDAGEGELEVDAHIISIGNGQYFGGGMRSVPNADPCDGLLDVCYARKMSKPHFLGLLPKYIKGKHVGLDYIEYFRTREITVKSDVAMPIDVDGDLVSSTPLHVKILEGAMKIILPPENVAY